MAVVSQPMGLAMEWRSGGIRTGDRCGIFHEEAM
jgi:hypothetical protein